MKKTNDVNFDSAITEMSDRDLYNSSSDKLLLVIPRSKSKNHQLAIELAMKVESRQIKIDNNLFTLCLISPAIFRDCEIAISILRIAGDWKGFSQIYNGKTLRSSFMTATVISCIMDAMRCKNPLANCLRHLREDEILKNPTYTPLDYIGFSVVAPCKHAAHRFYEPLLPVSVEDQYQAFTVEHDVYWCPLFNMENFKEISNRPKDKIYTENSGGDGIGDLMKLISNSIKKEQ
ncbi:hypothetical protein [Morganella morganii]|uniref:hypothetical protein n=1 Tax=Morganella morganii TaxID=582 RepID=UPI0028075C9D|nr:hypothetical protein [Morganella morganii subsp. sibonii]